jgi:hypothetical protein
VRSTALNTSVSSAFPLAAGRLVHRLQQGHALSHRWPLSAERRPTGVVELRRVLAEGVLHPLPVIVSYLDGPVEGETATFSLGDSEAMR